MFEGSLQKLYISLALIYVIPDYLNSRLFRIDKNDHIHLFIIILSILSTQATLGEK